MSIPNFKAKNLLKRLANYTQGARLEYRIQNMVANVASLETITTKWVKSLPSDHHEFSLWCIVNCMVRTGLCANCVVADSSNSYGHCTSKNCANNTKDL